MDPPLILGTRFLVGPDRATLRYFGAVRGTTGVWLGVEYDDPARGKHSGEKDGEQYFTCNQEGAGAFIRPTSPRIILPRSFLKTVLERYAPVSEEPLPDSDSLVLGRTNIQVNAPRLTKVRDRLGRTQELRELGVEAQGVGVFDEEEANQMESMGPWHTKSLNLAANLIPSWDIVALIVGHLEQLEVLNLNSNRLVPLPPGKRMNSLNRLLSISLSNTLMTWEDVLGLAPSMPALSFLEFASNRLESLVVPPKLAGPLSFPLSSSLRELRLDNNAFSSWAHLAPLRDLTSLSILSLNTNLLPSPPEGLDVLPSRLETLFVIDNRLEGWTSADVLADRCPGLKHLALRGNPFTDSTPKALARSGLIARFARLLSVEGSEITPHERIDAERFYLTLNPTFPAGQTGRSRWDELVAKHGLPNASTSSTRGSSGVLRDKLYDVTVRVHGSPVGTPDLKVSVLPTMPLRVFKLKLAKLTKVTASTMRVMLVVDGGGGGGGEELGSDDRKTVSELGVEGGSTVEVWDDDNDDDC